MYPKSTPGRTIHLRYMHYQMDPCSPHYLRHFQTESDQLDPSSTYLFGEHNLPLGNWARFDRLWDSIPEIQFKPEFSARTTAEMLVEEASLLIEATEDMMLAAGDFFHPILTHDSQAILEDDEYQHNLHSSPIWQETTSTYFQLACRIPVLLYLVRLGEICVQPQIEAVDVGEHLRSAIKALGVHLAVRPNVTLEESMELAWEYKKDGDYYHEGFGKSILAINMYVKAITHILPWFPSEAYMEPWEIRARGLGGIFVKLNINLAKALFKAGWVWPLTVYRLLEVVSCLSCVTNWEKAKILHLQAECSKRMSTPDAAVPKSRMRIVLARLDTPNYSILLTRKDQYLRKPHGELAQPSWIGDFGQGNFLNHYFELTKKLPTRAKNMKERWYFNVRDPSSYRMGRWVARMSRLHHIHMETIKGDIEPDDLAADNERQEENEGKTLWEHRVELPEVVTEEE